jgi:hypothetical protein
LLAAEWLRIYKEQFSQEAPKTWSQLKKKLIQGSDLQEAPMMYAML